MNTDTDGKSCQEIVIAQYLLTKKIRLLIMVSRCALDYYQIRTFLVQWRHFPVW